MRRGEAIWRSVSLNQILGLAEIEGSGTRRDEGHRLSSVRPGDGDFFERIMRGRTVEELVRLLSEVTTPSGEVACLAFSICVFEDETGADGIGVLRGASERDLEEGSWR